MPYNKLSLVDLSTYKKYQMVVEELYARMGKDEQIDELIAKALLDYEEINQFVSYIDFNCDTGSQDYLDIYKAELKEVPVQMLFSTASLMALTMDNYIQHNSTVEVPAVRW